MVDAAVSRPVDAPSPPGDGGGALRGLGARFWAPAAFLVSLGFVAVLAPSLGLPDPSASDFLNLQALPGGEHLLGTDALGRDILSRLIHGARISLTVGFVAPAIGLAVGLVVGLLAGYFRGWTDEAVVILVDTLLAVPGLVILLMFSTAFGGSLPTVCIGLGILFVPASTRISRAATLTYSQREFVLAAKATGAGDVRIILFEVLPNVIWPVAAFALVAIPIAIVAEGALSFLGLSVPAPTPSWGGMIAEGREHLDLTPHISLAPMALMFATVLSFNLAGDVLRRRLADVKEASI